MKAGIIKPSVILLLIFLFVFYSVAEGIQQFKESKHVEAMQNFNKALQIDAQNVEAFVARGAL